MSNATPTTRFSDEQIAAWEASAPPGQSLMGWTSGGEPVYSLRPRPAEVRAATDDAMHAAFDKLWGSR